MRGHMDTAEWQKRLEDTFSSNGIVGARLLEVQEQEINCGLHVAKQYTGQLTLIDSFQDFFIETLEKAIESLNTFKETEETKSYQLIVLFYIILFRRFRSCENLLSKGYPLDGYALLRDLKDRAVLLGAITNNYSAFNELFGQTSD